MDVARFGKKQCTYDVYDLFGLFNPPPHTCCQFLDKSDPRQNLVLF